MFLAIDTATDHIGLSLDDGDEVLAERVWQSKRHHTVELAPEVALMLRDCAVAPSDLKGIAVALGPGSYTGLRIGMAVAKGLALAHGLPMVGVPTLDILAEAQQPAEEPLLAVIKAGRSRVAAVWYKWGRQNWQPQTDPESFTWDELLDKLKNPTLVCGEIGSERKHLQREKNAMVLPPAACLRRPSFLAQIGRRKIEAEGPDDPAALAPTYLGDIEGG